MKPKTDPYVNHINIAPFYPKARPAGEGVGLKYSPVSTLSSRKASGAAEHGADSRQRLDSKSIVAIYAKLPSGPIFELVFGTKPPCPSETTEDGAVALLTATRASKIFLTASAQGATVPILDNAESTSASSASYFPCARSSSILLASAAAESLAFVSVWCFFAAAASMVILCHFEWARRRSPGAARA
jgi:hypothetical protein